MTKTLTSKDKGFLRIGDVGIWVKRIRLQGIQSSICVVKSIERTFCQVLKGSHQLFLYQVVSRLSNG